MENLPFQMPFYWSNNLDRVCLEWYNENECTHAYRNINVPKRLWKFFIISPLSSLSSSSFSSYLSFLYLFSLLLFSIFFPFHLSNNRSVDKEQRERTKEKHCISTEIWLIQHLIWQLNHFSLNPRHSLDNPLISM